MSALTAPAATPPLPVDDHELATCVACGLCLPHCPTWRVTGLERASPRGRIAAMRAVQWDGAPVDAEFERMMEECVQCRGCEPVCPAFVPFGHLMEGAREALHRERRAARPLARRLAEWVGYRLVLPRHWLLVSLTWALWLLQRAGLARLVRRSGAPLPLLDATSFAHRLRVGSGDGAGGEPVFLFTGCVADAWLRDTHRSTIRVLSASGATVSLPGQGADCCGALHLHAGRGEEARQLARRVVASMTGDAPVIVNSAGCGAVMKEYGRLLETVDAEGFAARVRDVHEWLAGRPALPLLPTGRTVVVQDPCHLRHVQRVIEPVRALLRGAYEVRETTDDGLCCGAGGAYNVLQAELSDAIRRRKLEALRVVGGGDLLVASPNPGCLLHLRACGVQAHHPMDLVARALPGEAAR